MADGAGPMLLGWVIVYVDDPPAAREFYMRAFGLQGGFVAGSRHLRRARHRRDEARASPPTRWASRTSRAACGGGGGDGPPPNVEIALVAEDVDARYAHALEAGCASLAEPKDKPQGQRVAYVRDPFGTLVELATPL